MFAAHVKTLEEMLGKADGVRLRMLDGDSVRIEEKDFGDPRGRLSTIVEGVRILFSLTFEGRNLLIVADSAEILAFEAASVETVSVNGTYRLNPKTLEPVERKATARGGYFRTNMSDAEILRGIAEMKKLNGKYRRESRLMI